MTMDRRSFGTVVGAGVLGLISPRKSEASPVEELPGLSNEEMAQWIVDHDDVLVKMEGAGGRCDTVSDPPLYIIDHDACRAGDNSITRYRSGSVVIRDIDFRGLAALYKQEFDISQPGLRLLQLHSGGYDAEPDGTFGRIGERWFRLGAEASPPDGIERAWLAFLGFDLGAEVQKRKRVERCSYHGRVIPPDFIDGCCPGAQDGRIDKTMYTFGPKLDKTGKFSRSDHIRLFGAASPVPFDAV